MRLARKSLSVFLAFGFVFFFAAFALAQSAYGPLIEKEGYAISRSKIERSISFGNIFKDVIIVTNKNGQDARVSIFPSDGVENLISVGESGEIIGGNNYSEINFLVIGRTVGSYQGELVFSGDINERIPVNITVVNESIDSRFFISVEPSKSVFYTKQKLDFKTKIDKAQGENIYNVSLNYSIWARDSNKTYELEGEIIDLESSVEVRKMFELGEEIVEGFYVLEVEVNYEDETFFAQAEFRVKRPFWSIELFGFLPIWLLAIILGVLGFGTATFVYIRREIEKRKKYKMQLYTKTLPVKGERTLKFGKVAETTLDAFYEMDNLTTHAVVAGATGGGKSIAAQVIIEEALMKNIAVIVFDPTAQWSGMLRKGDDQKMFSFYPKFGLKPSDARAFPGNVKQIVNERQAVDINKYMNPGQIQIFAMNKLTPPQIDIFAATMIASIFKGDPKEYPGLKAIIVFDEVHRLLPKFGGSGKGFLQIERACREFRKWGLGVMLVSQVLSDFVGEIKANINTEVQMRTRDEADLNRLKTKYGEEFLQSLIKASVGVGMFVNPKYNKGKPYFINFRPILHNTRRLSDAVLEQYNKYGEAIEDIEYEIEQLEAEKVDTFDLKMELKLVKDKLMSGNFTVVDIYLEGLKPRIVKQWDSLGKTPKKRELKLVDTSDIDASLKQAQKGRDDFEKEKKKMEEKPEEKKVDPQLKIVAPLTFDNGVAVSSAKELLDVLPSMDDSVFAEHVNEQKNDIAKWVGDNIDKGVGEQLKGAKKKEEVIKIVETIGKEVLKEDSSKKDEKSSDKKEVKGG